MHILMMRLRKSQLFDDLLMILSQTPVMQRRPFVEIIINATFHDAKIAFCVISVLAEYGKLTSLRTRQFLDTLC